MAYKNSFDTTGECARMGESAESSFAQLLAKKGKVRPASKQEQISHIDFILLQDDGKSVKYDVKARKKVSRADTEATDETVYIEFLNVGGNAGWLYGQSDFIAFEREKDFIVVDRLKLSQMAETKCDLTNKVSSGSQCLYKGYTRFGRRDLLSRVMMADIEAIACEKISKTV